MRPNRAPLVLAFLVLGVVTTCGSLLILAPPNQIPARAPLLFVGLFAASLWLIRVARKL